MTKPFHEKKSFLNLRNIFPTGPAIVGLYLIFSDIEIIWFLPTESYFIFCDIIDWEMCRRAWFSYKILDKKES